MNDVICKSLILVLGKRIARKLEILKSQNECGTLPPHKKKPSSFPVSNHAMSNHAVYKGANE